MFPQIANHTLSFPNIGTFPFSSSEFHYTVVWLLFIFCSFYFSLWIFFLILPSPPCKHRKYLQKEREVSREDEIRTVCIHLFIVLISESWQYIADTIKHIIYKKKKTVWALPQANPPFIFPYIYSSLPSLNLVITTLLFSSFCILLVLLYVNRGKC